MNSQLPKPVLCNKKEQVSQDLHRHYNYTLGRFDTDKSSDALYEALAYTLRDRLMERWRLTQESERITQAKKVYYLSLEFLLGRSLTNAILNLDMDGAVKEALLEFGTSIEEMQGQERDAGLGNGGLGRLAACFMDSCARLELPVTGYGIRYEYGMFHQTIQQGRQIEQPDHWLRDGNPWEIERPQNMRTVQFYGYTEFYNSDKGHKRARWVNTSDVLAIPYDMPIPGHKNDQVNTLRLWKAAATDEFNLQEFNDGDYADAVAQKTQAEQITMVLYPNDSSENGKVLRLRQQYFLASASLQDVVESWVSEHGEDFTHFAEKNCFQLNDTHPTLAVPELMRILMDDYHLEWSQAWSITTSTMAYTNHTLLPEALERWSVGMMGELLPRLLDIIYEINARFLVQVTAKWPCNIDMQNRMSIIEEGSDPQVRMAYLGIVGSFSVNGVAALHSKLLINGLFKDFYQLWPSKFNNKTNGVTPRRWLAYCNKPLAELLTEKIGDDWVANLDQIKNLKKFAKDKAFQDQWLSVKQENKKQLAELVKKSCGVEFDPEFIFDVQVKRIHEYKRQLLNVLHVIHLYDKIKRGEGDQVDPRCVLIGGKAAPGYALAKVIIKLINNVADVINNDPDVNGKLKLAFLPNYNVSSMEVICPATDLSEQISTAGKEASGTGNMKFMMNGALTIGTYDGANIEIMDAVGEEHFFLFGLKVEELADFKHNNNANDIINADENLKRVMQLLESGHFNMFEPHIFNDVISTIRNPHDPWMVAADFNSYITAQKQASTVYNDKPKWIESSILNSASSGHFSSDRTIGKYAEEIWKTQ